MGIRFFAAQIAGKTVKSCISLFSKRGTNLPGKIALKICPDMLRRYTLPITIMITGTNGKTSTSNMAAFALKKAGFKVTNNSEGSNMAAGIAAALIADSTLSGKIKSDYAVLEADERSSKYIYKYIIPDYILCTNLFRDSIYRNGHSEFIFNKINDYINEKTTLILNANDGVSGRLGGSNKKVYFGVDRTPLCTPIPTSNACDLLSCPECSAPISYEFVHFHHIGRPFCKECGFEMPGADYLAENIDLDEFSFTIGDTRLHFADGNFLNIFNMTACFALLCELGIEKDKFIPALAEFAGAAGRFKADIIGENTVYSMLSKNQNPISCSRSFAHMSTEKRDKLVVLLVTDSLDKKHGREDISWLYDADFELLAAQGVKKIIAAGTRCYDVGLRLVLAGCKPENIILLEQYDHLAQTVNQNKELAPVVFIFYELYAQGIARGVADGLRRNNL